MKKPTKEEITAEIIALKALKPVGRFAGKTTETIALQIEVLQNGIDDTCDEWNELTEEQQMAMQDADNWKNGYTKEKPSKDFGGLCD